MKPKNKLIQACLKCISACERCIGNSMSKDDPSILKIFQDCIDICSLTIRFENRKSKFAHDLAYTCLAICEECATECLKFAEHNTNCKICLEACQQCADICSANTEVLV